MPTALVDLLPHGSIQLIAHKLGIGKQAVSKALRKQRPGHPAVVEALRMARASGALDAAQELRNLLPEGTGI
jgi:hypothetical protein